jgi:hypothetical protein
MAGCFIARNYDLLWTADLWDAVPSNRKKNASCRDIFTNNISPVVQ